MSHINWSYSNETSRLVLGRIESRTHVRSRRIPVSHPRLIPLWISTGNTGVGAFPPFPANTLIVIVSLNIDLSHFGS